jgi:hypothetical protein
MHDAVAEATRAGAAVRLDVTGPGGAVDTLAVGHVLAATGYRLDLNAVSFLPPALPVKYRPGTEDSNPPLRYGAREPRTSLAAPMLGPMMRFVAGTEYAATRVARHLTHRTLTP